MANGNDGDIRDAPEEYTGELDDLVDFTFVRRFFKALEVSRRVSP